MSENKELMVKYELDGSEIKLTPSIVEQFIVGGNKKITIPEFKFFSELCKVKGLNPFLNEAYCIKFSDTAPAQIVVGKDAIYKRAIKNPDFDGIESGIIVETTDGQVAERPGTFYLKNKETLVGGWSRAYRKSWSHPTYCSVNFDEVAQKKDGKLNSNWAKRGATMVEKVAKVRALRETFTEDLGGMYEIEEMHAPTVEVSEQPIVEQKEPVDVIDVEVVDIDAI